MNTFFRSATFAFAVALGAASASATPTDDASTATTSTPRVVDRLDTFNTTASRFRLVSGLCGNSPGYFQIDKAHPAHAQMYEVLQSAIFSGRKVTVRYQLINNVCWAKAVNLSLP